MADTTIRWMTPKGTPVVLELRTSKETWADGDKIMVPDYALVCTTLATPRRSLSAPTIITHPVAGLCLREQNCGVETLVPVVAEVRDAVTALVAEYHAEMDRRNAEWIKGEREYEAHQARMRRAGFCDDPRAE